MQGWLIYRYRRNGLDFQVKKLLKVLGWRSSYLTNEKRLGHFQSKSWSKLLINIDLQWMKRWNQLLSSKHKNLLTNYSLLFTLSKSKQSKTETYKNSPKLSKTGLRWTKNSANSQNETSAKAHLWKDQMNFSSKSKNSEIYKTDNHDLSHIITLSNH